MCVGGVVTYKAVRGAFLLLDLVSGTGYEGVPGGPEPLNSQISFQGRKEGSCENLGNQNLKTGQNREGVWS